MENGCQPYWIAGRPVLTYTVMGFAAARHHMLLAISLPDPAKLKQRIGKGARRWPLAVRAGQEARENPAGAAQTEGPLGADPYDRALEATSAWFTIPPR